MSGMYRRVHAGTCRFQRGTFDAPLKHITPDPSSPKNRRATTRSSSATLSDGIALAADRRHYANTKVKCKNCKSPSQSLVNLNWPGFGVGFRSFYWRVSADGSPEKFSLATFAVSTTVGSSLISCRRTCAPRPKLPGKTFQESPHKATAGALAMAV